MAEANNNSDPKTGFVPVVIALAAVTVIAAGAATGAAWFDAGRRKTEGAAAATCASENKQMAELGDAVSTVLDLPSIVTNLAGDDEQWLRLDVSVVVPKPVAQKEQLTAELAQDFLGYVRSLTVGELSGGTNLHFLKKDLTELARIRTSDASLDVLIRTFVIE